MEKIYCLCSFWLFGDVAKMEEAIKLAAIQAIESHQTGEVDKVFPDLVIFYEFPFL